MILQKMTLNKPFVSVYMCVFTISVLFSTFAKRVKSIDKFLNVGGTVD